MFLGSFAYYVIMVIKIIGVLDESHYALAFICRSNDTRNIYCGPITRVINWISGAIGQVGAYIRLVFTIGIQCQPAIPIVLILLFEISKEPHSVQSMNMMKL